MISRVWLKLFYTRQVYCADMQFVTGRGQVP